MMRIFLAILVMMSCGTVWAAPSISSVTGTTSSGQTVTISGTGFGSGPTWSRYEDVEDNSLSGLAYDSSYVTIVTNNQRTGSTRCVKQDNKGGGVAYCASSPSNVIYMCAWRYLPSSAGSLPDYTGHKFFRLWNTCDYGSPDFLLMIYDQEWNLGTFRWYIENAGDNNKWGSYGQGSCLSSWHLYELYVDMANDCVYHWYDGSLVSSASGGDVTWGSWTGAYLFFDYYHENLSGTTNSAYIDDMYWANSQARVMLGNASTFSSCTHREIQPFTSWSSSSITITFNAGSFTSGQTAYLFVIDSSGSASSGYQITIRSGQTRGAVNATVSGGTVR